jgi:hypothetical protein
VIIPNREMGGKTAVVYNLRKFIGDRCRVGTAVQRARLLLSSL